MREFVSNATKDGECKKIRKILGSFNNLLFVFPLVKNVISSPPPLPSSFYGRVKINGSNVPSGTIVSAWIDGVKYADVEVIFYEGDSVYSLTIPADIPETPEKEGGVDGDTIIFQIGTGTAEQNGTWYGGTNQELNLSMSAIDGEYYLFLPVVIQ